MAILIRLNYILPLRIDLDVQDFVYRYGVYRYLQT